MTKCLNPECEKTFEQKPAGRKQKYCSGECRIAHWLADKKAKKEAKNVVIKEGVYDAPKWVNLMLDYFAKSGAKAEDLIECHSAAVAKVKISVKSSTDGGFKVGEKTAGGGVIDKIEVKKGSQVAHVKPEISGIQSKTVKDAKDVMTLEKIKALCPKHLQGVDKSIWISEERAKYKI